MYVAPVECRKKRDRSVTEVLHHPPPLFFFSLFDPVQVSLDAFPGSIHLNSTFLTQPPKKRLIKLKLPSVMIIVAITCN